MLDPDSNVASLVPNTRPDKELADGFKADLVPILEQACAVLNRARAVGMLANWSLIPDQFGRVRVGEVTVVKPL
jgi:hypothetical protein